MTETTGTTGTTETTETTELRWAVWPGLEVRMEGDEGSRTVVGVAPPWDSLSLPLWRDWRTGKNVREQFKRGAFSEVLRAPGFDCLALRDHSWHLLLGRTSSGTLRLRETDVGLQYEIDVPDTTVGHDLVVLLGRRDIRGSSFCFRVNKDDEVWRETETELIRTINKVSELDDIGPVVRPAYEESSASTRSLDAAKHSLEQWRGPEVDAVAAAARRRRLQIEELS